MGHTAYIAAHQRARSAPFVRSVGVQAFLSATVTSSVRRTDPLRDCQQGVTVIAPLTASCTIGSSGHTARSA